MLCWESVQCFCLRDNYLAVAAVLPNEEIVAMKLKFIKMMTE